MPSIWIHSFTVSGPWAFPTDMLRYDGCHPSTQTDVEKICPAPASGDTSVRLVAYNRKDWKPTSDRWASFGWRVSDHQKRAM